MFAPPYSPNHKFSNSKISSHNSKKSTIFPGKHCFRCQMKSQDSKYYSRKLTQLNPFPPSPSLKTLPNLKSLSSINTRLNAHRDKSELKKFQPFSTFGQKDSNKFSVTMKQNKKTSLSLERFNKELKSQQKISYKKVIIQSTKINQKSLVKKPGKKEFQNKKIYKLYQSLKDQYEKLKANFDKKVQFFQNNKKESSIILEKRNSKIKQNQNLGQSIEQSYQIRTEWGVKGKQKQKDSPNSRTSIQGQDCFISDNESKNHRSNQMKMAEVQKEKQFYRQECLGLQKQLQSVYNIVMQLKKQIQVLNEKNQFRNYEVVAANSQHYTLHNKTPIRNQEFYPESSIKESVLQQVFSAKPYFQNLQSPIEAFNSQDSQMTHFPTQESIESPSIIMEDTTKQDQNLFRKIPENQMIEKEIKDNQEEHKEENEVKKVRKIWRKVVCDSSTSNVIQQGLSWIQKNDSKISGTTWIGSSGISDVNSLKWDIKNLSQNDLNGTKYTITSPSSQNPIKYFKSEVVIKATDEIETTAPIIDHARVISVNRYHSYCKKNCDINQCKCLLEMMTVVSSNSIPNASCQL